MPDVQQFGRTRLEVDARKIKALLLGASTAWAQAVSSVLTLPGLRAFWQMSGVDYQQPECTDMSGHGYDLQAAAALGNVTFGHDPNNLTPIANFGGAANQYLLRADGGAGNWADILGTEAYIQAADRGLTLGGWFWWSALPGAVEFLMAKDDVGANRQYVLFLDATDQVRLAVWPGPIGITTIPTINVGWNHCIGIYDQSSQTVFVELNGVIRAGGAGAAPAALVDTAAPFTIGADGGGTRRFTGYASGCFLCAASAPQAAVLALFHQTRAMYGA